MAPRCSSKRNTYIVAISKLFESYFKSEQNTTGIGIEIPEYYLLGAFSHVTKCSFRLVFPNDPDYGRRLGNGSWTGVIGLVHRFADLGLSQLTISSERMEAVSFGNPFDLDNLRFLTTSRMISKIHEGTAFFLLPFETETWIILCVMVSLLTLITKLVLNLLDKVSIKNKTFGYSRPADHILRILLQQDVTIQPRLRRFLMSSITCVPFICYFYAAFLTSSTSLNEKQEVIMTEGDLIRAIEQGDYRVIFCPGSLGTKILKTSQTGVLGSIREANEKYAEKIISSTEHIFEKLNSGSGNVAFLGEWILKARILTKGLKPGSYHFLEGDPNPIAKGIAFSKTFRCLEEFNRIIIRSAETGLMEKWRSFAMTAFNIGNQRIAKTGVIYINFQDFLKAHLLLAFGCFLAILIFCAEIIYIAKA